MKIAKPVHELILDNGIVVKIDKNNLMSNDEYIEKYLGKKKEILNVIVKVKYLRLLMFFYIFL